MVFAIECAIGVLGSARVFRFTHVENNLFHYEEILHYVALRSE
ncbi:hypothetical protein BHF72_1386 [Cloacibacterium normanense]|uniref:Uncharacterized protein n=1 Tax=Cloacibacterium normanense TaxID=237258 RepID=A0A1E5UHB0_9FLAO|nr:hypothetical protein BHF72_1386 [Cloacibacterium normanense]